MEDTWRQRLFSGKKKCLVIQLVAHFLPHFDPKYPELLVSRTTFKISCSTLLAAFPPQSSGALTWQSEFLSSLSAISFEIWNFWLRKQLVLLSIVVLFVLFVLFMKSVLHIVLFNIYQLLRWFHAKIISTWVWHKTSCFKAAAFYNHWKMLQVLDQSEMLSVTSPTQSSFTFGRYYRNNVHWS